MPIQRIKNFIRRKRSADDRRTVTLGASGTRKKYCTNEKSSAKYNLLTFLPMNLWEQFHRPINMYFLIVAAIQFIPSVAPVSPYTTIFPIVVAFLINTVKEGVDDIRRHGQDRAYNHRRFTIVNPATCEHKAVKCMDICVGDLVLLKPQEMVPADVVILGCSGADGEVYISTESLDGETGTKQRLAVLTYACGTERNAMTVSSPTTTTTSNSSMHPRSEEEEINRCVRALYTSRVVLDSEGPNKHLHAYHGTLHATVPGITASSSSSREDSEISTAADTITTNDEEKILHVPSHDVSPMLPPNTRHPLLSPDSSITHNDGRERKMFALSSENVIMAASTMRNTHFVLAMVIFTGRETKLSMTSSATPTKWAIIDKRINCVAIAIFALQVVFVSVYSMLSSLYLSTDSVHLWYLGLVHTKVAFSEHFPILPLRYFSMVSPMVPLSFKVMVELSKVYISYSVRWDDGMRDQSGRTSVNNSALAEDLGQVEYILSDKTGTLTTNTMTFKALANAEGELFEGPDAHALLNSASKDGADLPTSTRCLLYGMVFCNSIERSLAEAPPPAAASDDEEEDALSSPPPLEPWVSCSPDEVALVDGAKHCGFALRERTRSYSTATLGDAESITVTFVKILPFSSQRGMMSVLIRMMDGSHLLLTKGSDEKVLPLCLDLEEEYSRECDGGRLPLDRRPDALLGAFSLRGLRTLVFAYRVVSREEVNKWLAAVGAAASIGTEAERSQATARAYATMECNLTYCGCTAVEDQLQDDIQDTILRLRQANIRVWMLTGDKSETAKQTAIGSGLLTPMDRLINLTPNDNASIAAGGSNVDSIAVARHVLRDVVSELDPSESPWYTRWYEASGLSDYANEFLRPFSADHLQSFDHSRRRAANASFEEDIMGQEPVDVYEGETTAEGIMSSSVPECGAGPSCATPSPAVGQGYCVMLSGRIIRSILSSADPELIAHLKLVLLHADTVICSRTAPDEKAFVVKTVKDAGKVTLAIGDGGNDVAMIQAAHVGVGIKGKEGSQAALAADFSITQFKFLARLLLVHGHMAYHRTAMIVQQSFWKTVLIAWVQLLFNIYTRFSAVSFWDSFSLMIYNSIPTVPVTFLCMLDVPISSKVLLRNPLLYRMSQRGRYLNPTTFYGYIARAFLHGVIIFYLAVGINNSMVFRNGHAMDRGGDFYAAYFAVVTIHTYTVLSESHSITFIHWQCFFFSIWTCFLCFYIFALVPQGNQTFLYLLHCPLFYLSYIGITTVVCLSLALFASIKVMWFPDLLQLQRMVMLAIKRSRSMRFTTLHKLFPDDNPSRFLKSLFVVCGGGSASAYLRAGEETNNSSPDSDEYEPMGAPDDDLNNCQEVVAGLDMKLESTSTVIYRHSI